MAVSDHALPRAPLPAPAIGEVRNRADVIPSAWPQHRPSGSRIVAPGTSEIWQKAEGGFGRDLAVCSEMRRITFVYRPERVPGDPTLKAPA